MRTPIALILIGGLLGCQSEQASDSAAGSQSESSARSGPTASAESERVEAKRSDEYELRIVAAEIDPAHRPLQRAVSLYSAQVRDEFLGQVAAAKAEGFEFALPWQLELELRRTVDQQRLVAVEANGFQFQGGAHGLPLQATFVYLVDSAQVMQIGDWFVDQAVWEAISQASIAALGKELAPLPGEDDEVSEQRLDEEAGQWLAEGAGADPQNFQLYLPVVNEAGLIAAFQISFAPYQVAPYAAGSPQVEITADVLVPHLKPEYRDFFVR